MGTHWHFECPEHEPPLLSEDEFTQHTEDSYYRDGIEMALSRPLREDYSADDSYFQAHARRFLYRHPRCHLNLVSEEGERRLLEIEGRSLADGQAQLLRTEIAALQAQVMERMEQLEQVQIRQARQ